jgi:flagellar biosynthesis anti-sigma factor FlgM
MKVDFTNIAAEAPNSAQTSAKTSRAGGAGSTGGAAASGAAASSSSGADQATFSFDQVRVQSLAAQVLAQPEIRAAKVQSLQQAIGSSAYSVSPGQVADALTSELGGISVS